MMHIYNDIIERNDGESENNLCINEIDVTDIGEQYSVKGILREFINQEEILIVKEEIPKEEK